MKTIRAYWSHQSAYCYFALDRLLALNARADVRVELRPVLPGVVRDGNLFSGRSELEQSYFLLDVARTAEFLGLPYAEADPYPVSFAPGTLYQADGDQTRVMSLYYLTAAAIELGQGWAFLDKITRLIWDGSTKNWNEPDTLQAAIRSANINDRELSHLAQTGRTRFDALFAANREAMMRAGHWGVPMFEFEGEPFYGQDRLDQLSWRLS